MSQKDHHHHGQPTDQMVASYWPSGAVSSFSGHAHRSPQIPAGGSLSLDADKSNHSAFWLGENPRSHFPTDVALLAKKELDPSEEDGSTGGTIVSGRQVTKILKLKATGSELPTMTQQGPHPQCQRPPMQPGDICFM